jgi:hypothetical protein
LSQAEVGGARRVRQDSAHAFFFAPERSMLLIASGGRPDFSAISRSCSIRNSCAGWSPSMPPISARGTLRFERWLPSS